MTETSSKVEEYKKLEGEVWLNGKLIYNGLTPKISQTGLRIYRVIYNNGYHSHAHDGPHFDFIPFSNFCLQNCISCITTESLLKGVNFSFSGLYLGATMMGSHTKDGIGPLVRHITHLNFYVCIRKKQFYFEFSGKTSELLPWSLNYPDLRYSKDPHEFKVFFNLPKELIPTLSDTESWISMMSKKLESC